MASGDPKAPKTTTSGIQTLASGSRVIPSSLRADGTTRPERRVKPGFTPAEDVVKYQNRTAEAFRNRGSGSVPGATPVPGAAAASPSNTGGAKKKRSRKKKTAGEGDGKDEEGEEEGPEGEEKSTNQTEVKTEPPKELTASVDAEKKAKALQKKIRQAQELKSRKDRGETLLPEQLDKALRLGELIRDLEKMGFKHEE